MLNLNNIILSSKLIYWFIYKSKVAYHLGARDGIIGTRSYYSYDDWKECSIDNKEYFLKKMLERYKERIKNNVLYQLWKMFKDTLKGEI